MYAPWLRILIGTLGLILAYFYYSVGSNLSVALMLTGVALVVWGYFKNGTIYLAFRKLKKEDYEGAERSLNQTKYPELLKNGQKGYFHFIKGFIESNRNDYNKSLNHFREALKFGLRTDNDQAIVRLSIAEIEIERKNYDNAREELKVVKGLKYKQALESEILRLETKLIDSAERQD